MEYNDFGKDGYQFLNGQDSRLEKLEMERAFPALMRKVYTWMALALVITGITAYGVASSPGLMQMIYGSRFVLIGMAITELAIVFMLPSRIHKLSLQTATLWFIVFSVLNGATLSSIFMVYTMSSIAKVFFITAGTFAAMAFIGTTTKRDLSTMGGYLMMALIGGIIAMVVNMFMKSAMFDYILSWVIVAIFVGLTAWDAQNIKRMLLMSSGSSESSQKIALLGSLSLYLDFINLFIYLLRLLGASSRD